MFCYSPLATARKLYPIRIRIVNIVTKEPQWVTVAYVPVVKKFNESAADERANLRRSAVLQRVLYMAFRSVINASHSGVTVYTKDGTPLTAFPRLLLYIADQPEERAVLALKQDMGHHPCSHCDVRLEDCGTARAVNANERQVLRTLRRHSEATRHRHFSRQSARLLELEAEDSLTSFMPAIAGMAGLSTGPNLLYRTIGFDMLHLRGVGHFFLMSIVWRSVACCSVSSF